MQQMRQLWQVRINMSRYMRRNMPAELRRQQMLSQMNILSVVTIICSLMRLWRYSMSLSRGKSKNITIS